LHRNTPQSFKILMYQDFQQSTVIAVQSADCNDCITDCNKQVYTVTEIAQLLSIKDRQVYNLAKTLIAAWYWLPESAIRSDGIYTQFALDEMKHLKGCKNAKEYTVLVAKENQKPVLPNTQHPTTNTQPQTTALTLAPAQLPTRYTDQIESKLATLQQNTAALNLSIQDRVAAVRERLQMENTRANNNRSALDELERQQAIARGVAKGMEIYELEQQAVNATLEQLLLEKLQNQA
jgi:hypothetical protein